MAATDSDDASRDIAMDPEDFDFSVEPIGPSRDGEGAIFPPPVTTGGENSWDSDRRGGDGGVSPPTSGCARWLSTLTDMDSGGGGEKEGGVVLPPPPPIGEQVSLVRELMEDEELNKLKPGQSRFLVGLRCGRRRVWAKRIERARELCGRLLSPEGARQRLVTMFRPRVVVQQGVRVRGSLA